MPFDSLPGHQIQHWEFKPYIAPPRPIIPWADMIVPAVDKLANASMYLTPMARQQRSLEMAKIGYERQLFAQMQNGQSGMNGMKFTANGQLVPLSPLERARLRNMDATYQQGQVDRGLTRGFDPILGPLVPNKQAPQQQQQSRPAQQYKPDPNTWNPNTDFAPPRPGMQFDTPRDLSQLRIPNPNGQDYQDDQDQYA